MDRCGSVRSSARYPVPTRYPLYQLLRGEPLLHTRLADMISMVVAKGMEPALITNGWLLPAQLDRLAATGLKTVYVSIDAAAMSVHEANRGLKGLEKRIRLATAYVHELKMTPLA